jgi:hypothetical protein
MTPIRFATQEEHEEREDQREELHAFLAGRAANRGGDELVGDFCNRLQPSRNHGAAGGRADHQRGNAGDRKQHEQRGIGESDFLPADLTKGGELLDFKL